MSRCALSTRPGIKSILLYLLSITLFSACDKQERVKHDSTFQNGNVIFQSLRSGTSDAIQLATHSDYSHCGIIFWEGDKCYVYEALQRVNPTPIEMFLQRSAHYAVRRSKDAATLFLTEEKVNAFIRAYYKKFNGKPYDVLYDASDDKIYCSELVWKLYDVAAHVDVGEWRPLREFDLKNDVVQEQLKLTYGDNIPLDERIISPEALFVSDKFVTVIENSSHSQNH